MAHRHLAIGAALMLAACGARAADTTGAASGGVRAAIPELVTRCLDGRELEGKIAACTRAVEAKAGSREMQAVVLHHRAQAWCFSGQAEPGIADEDRAIALVPDFAEAWEMRGSCRMLAGDPHAAQKDYAQAVRLAPDVAGLHAEAAKVDNWVGDHALALQRYEEAIRLAPRFNRAVDERAKTLFNLGRYDEAAEGFEKAIQMTPGDARPVLWLHLSRLRDGKPDAAEFERNMKSLDLAAWPRPVFDLFRGRVSLEVMRDAGRAEGTRDGFCEGAVFGGEYLLAKGDKRGAHEQFAEAILVCGAEENRYLTAWAELKKLDPTLRGPW